MLKAANKWVQIEVETKKSGFQDFNSSLLEGNVVSVGPEVIFKKGQTVLFPSSHAKIMEAIIGGKKYYFVDESVILAYE